MTRINILGKGLISLDKPLGFKKKNPFFRFAEVEVERSVSFTIPATDDNELTLGFAGMVTRDGEAMRRRLDCQVVGDSVVMDGVLVVERRTKDGYDCVFVEKNKAVETLQGRKLSECPAEFLHPNGVVWSRKATAKTANAVDFDDYCELVLYARDLPPQVGKNFLVSVNVYEWLKSMLDGFGVAYSLGIPTNVWAVCPTLKKRNKWKAVFVQTTRVDASVTETSSDAALSVENGHLFHADSKLFGMYVNVSQWVTALFKANRRVSLSFPQGTPMDFYLVKVGRRLNDCEVLGGGGAGEDFPPMGVLAGRTIDIEAGERFTFTSTPLENFVTGGYGWKDNKHPFSLEVEVEVSADIEDGDTWQLADNLPDVEVFDFIKWVCIGLGLEYSVDNGIVTIDSGGYKGSPMAIGDVEEVEEVTRRVPCWGSDTRTAVVEYDSDKWVEGRIVKEYEVNNSTIDGEKSHESGFSEGNDDGSGNVKIDDFSLDAPHDITTDRWTLCVSGQGKLLRRVEPPDRLGYDAIADDSTALRVKVKMAESEFHSLKPFVMFAFQGVPFVWTDAEWADGMARLTLQQVDIR